MIIQSQRITGPPRMKIEMMSAKLISLLPRKKIAKINVSRMHTQQNSGTHLILFSIYEMGFQTSCIERYNSKLTFCEHHGLNRVRRFCPPHHQE